MPPHTIVVVGYEYYNFGFGKPSKKYDKRPDPPIPEEDNKDQILKWMQETEDFRKLSDEGFKQAANAMGKNELMTKALHILFENLVTQEQTAVRNSMITIHRLLSQAIHN